MPAQEASGEIFRGPVRFHDSVLRRLDTAEAFPNHIYEGDGTQKEVSSGLGPGSPPCGLATNR